MPNKVKTFLHTMVEISFFIAIIVIISPLIAEKLLEMEVSKTETRGAITPQTLDSQKNLSHYNTDKEIK